MVARDGVATLMDPRGTGWKSPYRPPRQCAPADYTDVAAMITGEAGKKSLALSFFHQQISGWSRVWLWKFKVEWRVQTSCVSSAFHQDLHVIRQKRGKEERKRGRKTARITAMTKRVIFIIWWWSNTLVTRSSFQVDLCSLYSGSTPTRWERQCFPFPDSFPVGTITLPPTLVPRAPLPLFEQPKHWPVYSDATPLLSPKCALAYCLLRIR